MLQVGTSKPFRLAKRVRQIERILPGFRDSGASRLRIRHDPPLCSAYHVVCWTRHFSDMGRGLSARGAGVELPWPFYLFPVLTSICLGIRAVSPCWLRKSTTGTMKTYRGGLKQMDAKGLEFAHVSFRRTGRSR